MKARTMIYLDPEELEALRREARALGVSLAELVRRVVRQHLDESRVLRPNPSRALLKLVGLGSSGRSDVAERHDAYLGEALTREHLR